MIDQKAWQKLELELVNLNGRAEFRLGDDIISVSRSQLKEGVFPLFVYINGQIKGEWYFSSPNDKATPDAVKQTFFQRSQAYYTPQQIKAIIKDWGKRDAKRYFPKLYLKHIYLTPNHPSAKQLIRQFKSISGLQLLTIGDKEINASQAKKLFLALADTVDTD